MEIVEWILRIFGLFWIFGAIMVLREALKTKAYDDILSALNGKPEEKLTLYYGYAVAFLTLISGISLALAHPFSPYCVGSLVIVQALYFALKHHRYLQASNDEERSEWRISSQSKNAFWVSLVIMFASMILYL